MKNIVSNRLHKRGLFRSALSVFLTVVLCLSLFPPLAASAAPYYEESVNKLVGWDVLRGYPDGSLIPENPITRAEFVAMVNRAYGYSDRGPTPFQDVAASDWFANDISIAYTANYFNGTSTTTASPNANLTREQAMVLLAKNMRLDEVGGEITQFSDGHGFSSWSQGYVMAAVQKGMINGYTDGSFRPGNSITRGEMATLLARALGNLINKEGTHSLGDVYGNVTISSSNTTLKDTTVAGDLYISGGLGLNGVTLDNVRVLGNIIVAGGGEAQSGDSVILRNTEADSLLLDSIADQYLSVRAEGNTLIDSVLARTDAYIMDRTASGSGLKSISLDGGGQYTLAGNVENVVNKSPLSHLIVGAGTVRNLTIDEEAAGSVLTIDQGAVVRDLTLDTGVTVTGDGDVDDLSILTAGSTVEMLPDSIDIRPGVTASVAGETLNSAQASESSSDPRLLAGYPAVKSLAPTSATGVFSTNKSGTVYWAVTPTTDGSARESVLLDPASSSILTASGNLAAAASSTEYTASITGLTPGASYYLSAVLVDARKNHSAVKVVSFTAPDNSVPAFASGYPAVTQNDYNNTYYPGQYHVQVSAMATKSCDLYWALYEKGAVAPTAAEFRAGALGGAIAHGVQAVTRSSLEFVNVGNLAELNDYVMFLWLNDADNAKSSAVSTLNFKTIDGTPPEFQYDTPTVITPPLATSIRMDVNVNEAGTVYWVAVNRGSTLFKDYEKALEDDGTLTIQRWMESAQRQMESGSGTGVIRKGSSAVRKDTNTTITVSGLTAATKYDVYFVAKDTAGNYSLLTKDGVPNDIMYKRQANTLDNIPPTAAQEFTHFSGTDTTTPYADTDVKIVFSEEVMQYSANKDEKPEDFKSFYALYEAATAANAPESDKTAFYNALSGAIRLYRANSDSNDPLGKEVIDYTKAKVELDSTSGKLTVEFDNESGAINLSSGSTYYFVLDDIADVSDSMNRMGETRLPNFTTISAQVRLRNLNVSSIPGTGESTVPIDMAFSMTPVSTNVEDDVQFDVLFWSDTSVAFEVYELTPPEGDSTAYTGTLLPSAGSPANVEIVNETNGYIARSLYNDFYQTDCPKAKSMETKYYGIHFTAVEGSSELTAAANRTAWDALITYHISVVTDSGGYLSDMTANGVTEEKFAFYEARGVTEIQTDKPFELTKNFSNSTSPGFNDKYPKFTASDSSVTMTVQLERPGTLYYAIVPASTKLTSGSNTSYAYNTMIPTKAEGDDDDLQIRLFTGSETTLNVGAYATLGGGSQHIRVYSSINGAITDVPTAGRTDSGGETAPFYLSEPISRTIYSPNFDSSVKTGKATVSASATNITVDGLSADTLYLVYFVTQGTGQVYSPRPMLFEFTTAATFRPNLVLQSLTTSTVRMTSSNMNAVTDYAVFQIDQLSGTLLGQTFVTAANLTAVNCADYATIKDYKVWQAIQNANTDGVSYFDLYAPDDLKRGVADLISNTAGTTGGGWIGGRTEQAIPMGSTGVTVDCATLGIASNVNYFFAACGWFNDPATTDKSSRNVLTDSIAFRGVSPITVTDTSTPKLTDITGHLTVDYDSSGNATVSGTVTLQFDKELYYYNRSADSRRAIVLASANASGLSSDAAYASVGILRVTGTGFSFQTDDSNYTSTTKNKTSSIPLEMNATYGSVTLSGNLSSENSSGIGSNLIFTVDLRNVVGTGRADATLSGPAGIWANGENIQVTATVTRPAVNPTGISLDTSSLNLIKGSTGALKATITPAGATGTVSWSSDNVNVASVDNAGVVTAKKFGTATITATLNNAFGTPVTTTCTVTVSANSIAITNSGGTTVGNYTLSRSSSGSTPGAVTLWVKVAPTDSSIGYAHDDVVWSCDNNNVTLSATSGTYVTVNANASATGNTSVLTARAGNTTTTCIITITP